MLQRVHLWQVMAGLLVLVACLGNCRKDAAVVGGPLFPAARGPRHMGFINDQGKFVIPPDYEFAKEFHEGLAAVGVNGRHGFINRDNKVVIPLAYEEVDAFSEGLAAFRKGSRWGFLNRAGEVQIGCEYEVVSGFSCGVASVQKEGLFGIIDVNGRWVCEPVHRWLRGFQEGMAAYQSPDGLWGFLNCKGEVELKPVYAEADSFSLGRAVVKLKADGPGWMIDRKGEMVAGPFEELQSFAPNGLAVLRQKGVTGFLNLKGELLLKPEWKRVNSFAEGLAAVRGDGWSGYVNGTGDVVIRLGEEMWILGPVGNGLAYVATMREEGYVNRAGGRVYWRKKKGTE